MKKNFGVSDSGLFACLAIYLASSGAFYYAGLAIILSAICANN